MLTPPAPPLKRKLTLTPRPLSPPPPRKRPRVHPTPSSPPSSSSTPPLYPHRPFTIPSPAPNHIRIYAWNVNGIAALLPPHPKRPTHQRPITSFLTHPTASSPRTTGTSHPKPDDSAPEPVHGNGQEKEEGKGNSLRARLRRWKFPEIVCLQEVQIARTDVATQRAVQAAINPRPRPSAGGDSDASSASDDDDDDDDDDDGETTTDDAGPEPTYTAHFGLPRSAYNARGRRGDGKIYGVATLVRDDFAGREVAVAGREVEWDREGRVLVTELRCGVVVMNVYAVNGTESVWRDEGDGRVVGTRHEKKRVVHAGLVGEWVEWVNGGLRGREEGEGNGEREVLMIGDMNVARDERDGWPGIRLGEQHVRNRKDFERRFFGGVSEGGLGAMDSFREVHGGERRYSYFPRGRVWGRSCDRVDLGVVSRGLVERGCLVGADIMDDPMERGSSDHVPLYVVLEVGESTNEKDVGG